jgi:cytochrome d ubiquinol oxidase subunit I
VGHYVTAILVCAGSWLSGFFIIATNAWMQHPVAYAVGPKGEIMLTSFWGLMFNPWTGWQYAHNMLAAVFLASVVMAGLGSFYLLNRKHEEYGATFVRLGVMAGFISSVLILFPSGDGQGRMVAHFQKPTLAAMEGVFQTSQGAAIHLIGQPDMEKRRIDNPISIPRVLSFITYQRWMAEVKGLDAFPADQVPDNIPLLFYSFHIMAGLGTIFIALMTLAALLLYRDRLLASKAMLWALLLLVPFPYIATVAGWTTAEIGRQPWLIYGVMRTAEGSSPYVSSGSAMFTLLGFMGMYSLLSMLFLLLVYREIDKGPEPTAGNSHY